MKGKFLFMALVCLGVSTNLNAKDYLVFMPFQNGERWSCPQGNNGQYSHFGKLQYAYDFTAWQSSSFGKKVYSPVRGVVVDKRDNAPDYMYNDGFYPENNNGWGNTVLLKDYATGKAIRLAHMRQGSIKVELGEHVEVGQQIGEVGQSGFSSEPHLHIHMQNETTNTADYQSIPFYFVEGPVVTGDLVKSELNAMTFVIDDEEDVSLGNYVSSYNGYYGGPWGTAAMGTNNMVGKRDYKVKYTAGLKVAPSYYWRFTLNKSGFYYIWVKFFPSGSKDPSAEYRLTCSTVAPTTIYLNQKKLSSDYWYPFVLTYLKAGTEYTIRLKGTTKDTSIVADGVKFQQMPW